MLRTEAADEVLLGSVASDPEAFAMFYRRHEDRILRYFLRRGATTELAADLTAEVFAAALVAADRFEPGGAAAAWLYGIARNTLAASRRRGRVEALARARLGMAPVELSDDSLDRSRQRLPLRMRWTGYPRSSAPPWRHACSRTATTATSPAR